ncbi:MAG: hypothetical protein FGM28_10665, partial [Limnohabitans sp.]|nr:hypothetical protein [Limnohabitans sp.]
MSLSIHILEGGAALSDFRQQQLLESLSGVDPAIVGLQAQHLYCVAFDAQTVDIDTWLPKVAALLADEARPAPSQGEAAALIVSPRLGTVSPWASKATDIAHNCGLPVRRVERITEYHLRLKGGLLRRASLSEA